MDTLILIPGLLSAGCAILGSCVAIMLGAFLASHLAPFDPSAHTPEVDRRRDAAVVLIKIRELELELEVMRLNLAFAQPAPVQAQAWTVYPHKLSNCNFLL